MAALVISAFLVGVLVCGLEVNSTEGLCDAMFLHAPRLGGWPMSSPPLGGGAVRLEADAWSVR